MEGAIAVDPDDQTNSYPVTLTVSDITTGIIAFTNAAITTTEFTVTPNQFGMIGKH